MKKAISIFATFLSLYTLKAQVASDALRYSYIPQYGGTARAIGVGGSMGAIGGDFSTISTNPAGLATYRTGELVFSPSFHGAKTTSLLDKGGTEETLQRFTKFSLDNLGLVFSNGNTTDKWRTRNFAIGFNRLQNFNSNIFYEGTTTGSITARFRDQANIEGLDEFESKLADSTGAIYTKLVNGQRKYTTDFDLNPAAGVYKSQVIETRGSVSEMVIAYAGNYDEKLQIGGTIGIPFIRFTENKIYKEEDKLNQVPFFEKLQFDQNLTTSGIGINAKLGAIVRPTKSIRLGLAIHTPTKYQLSDSYSNTLYYVYTDSLRYTTEAASPEGDFKYKLATPWRFIGSAGFILGKSGFLSADVEWADYSQANFALDKEYATTQNDVNKQITDRYKSALNVRVGGEYVYDIFRFRAGLGLNGSPRQDKDFWNTTYNAGVGVRGRHFYMDFAWQQRTQKENYTPYKVLLTQANTEQNVTNAYTFNDYVLTFGIKF
ncbi:MAG: outer membrane protein transport protein [Saprospiraceae bacterium]|nr:outer membrane protein transport protein [Saprospiraceae bacterium]